MRQHRRRVRSCLKQKLFYPAKTIFRFSPAAGYACRWASVYIRDGWDNFIARQRFPNGHPYLIRAFDLPLQEVVVVRQGDNVFVNGQRAHSPPEIYQMGPGAPVRGSVIEFYDLPMAQAQVLPRQTDFADAVSLPMTMTDRHPNE